MASFLRQRGLMAALRSALARACGLALGGVFLAAALAQVPAALTQPDWVQLAAGGQDASASHGGRRWYVGTDGRAYRWDDARQTWLAHGRRSDLVRIDASDRGAAAVARDGEVYVTGLAVDDDWRPLGVRAADVGLGADAIWLADAAVLSEEPGLLTARFEPTGTTPDWRRYARRFVRVDVDPAGRPWALDAAGRLFLRAGGRWQTQEGAPPGADIGVGGGGAVYLVGRRIDDELGGGAVWSRSGADTAWQPVPGRLNAVSVDPEGRAFGTNSLAWVVAGLRIAPGETMSPEPVVSADDDPAGPAVALADIAGPDLQLPPSIAKTPVYRVRGQVAEGLFIGTARLNGLKTQVVRYTPEGGAPPTLALGHESMTLGDYVPELAESGAQVLRPSQVVFFFVPEGATPGLPTADDAALIAPALGRDDLRTVAPPAGISWRGTVDPRQVPDLAAVAGLLGMGTSPLTLRAEGLAPALWTSVRPGKTRPVVRPTTLDALRVRYGEATISSLVLTAPASDLDGRRAGPLGIASPVWTLALTQGTSSVEWQVALEAQLSLALRAPAPPKVSSAGVAAAPPTTELLRVDDARLLVDPANRRVAVDGTLTREQAANLASLRGLQLKDARFEAAVQLAGPAPAGGPITVEAVDLRAAAQARLPTLSLSIGLSVAQVAGAAQTTPTPTTGVNLATAGAAGASVTTGAGVDLDVELTLALDDTRASLVPAVRVTGELTLAQLSGIDSAPARAVKLTEVAWTPSSWSGTASLYGLPVRVSRYQSGEDAAIVGLQHRELDLATYLPQLRGLPSVGSFGLGNAVAFVLPENAAAVSYATRDEMPEALSALLDRADIPDSELFPLALKPGVSLLGQYAPDPSGQPGLTARVLAAWGVEDQPYVVKANFRASALRRPTFSTYTSRGGELVRDISARDVACAAAEAVDQADLSGLDFGFNVPGFKPPYLGGAVQFSNTRFTIREVDGQLEPALVAAATIRLPEPQLGLQSLGLATKLQLRGDLSTLCKGITPDTNGMVYLAGVTAYNAQQIGSVAFRALERVAGEPPAPVAADATSPTPAPAPRLAGLAVPAGTAPAPEIGWKRAFGLPFLNVRQFALSGRIEQKDGQITLDGSVWSDSVLGTEPIDLYGRLSLASPAEALEFGVRDWALRVPGPVKLTGLPGMKRLAEALPVVELGDLRVSELALSPTEMTGALDSASRRMNGRALLRREAGSAEADEAYELFAGINRFALQGWVQPSAGLGAVAGAVSLGDSFIALRTRPTETWRVGDFPADIRPLLTAAFSSSAGPLLSEDSLIPMVRGLTMAGRLSPAEIDGTGPLAPVKDLFALFGMTGPEAGPVPVLGGIETTETGSTKAVVLDALVPRIDVPGLPAPASASVRNLRVGLNTVDGRNFTGTGQALVTAPTALQSFLGPDPIQTDVSVRIEGAAEGDSAMRLSARTTLNWPETLSLPGLTLGGIALEVESRRAAGAPVSSDVVLTADASYNGVPARARLATTREGRAPGGVAVELIAVDPAGRLDLAALLNPLKVLPDGYLAQAWPTQLFRQLTSRSLLLAREPGDGRVSVLAEDVQGQLNAQPFVGQLAVVGMTKDPVLFIRSDQALTAGRVFDGLVPTGPLASLGLPEGLVILAPGRAELNLSEIHPRIQEQVWAKLLETPESIASFVANEGLTVVAWLDLPERWPAELEAFAPFLPRDARLLLAGGLETVEGVRRLAFTAQGSGLRLSLPAPVDRFVRSAGGQVAFNFRSVRGGDDNGWEASLASEAVLEAPAAWGGTPDGVPARFSLAARRDTGSQQLQLQLRTGLAWPAAYSLPGLTVSELGLDADLKREGTGYSGLWALSSQARFRGTVARARVGVESDGSATRGGLVELRAELDGGRLDLAPQLDPAVVWPDTSSAAIPLSPFGALSARSLLLARQVGSGDITVAAEDVEGRLGELAFKGQLALTGPTRSPVLFVRSDEPVPLRQAFGSRTPALTLGALADVTLPRGLVVLSPAQAGVRWSEVHPVIVDKVLSGLAEVAAGEFLANEGLTVLASVPMPGGLPGAMQTWLPWLPDSGQVLLGAGVERNADGSGRLALYGETQGVSLRIPAELQGYVRSAGGRLRLTAEAVQGDEAGVDVSLETDATVRLPGLDGTPSRDITTALTVQGRRAANGDSDLRATVATDLGLPTWAAMPKFSVDNFALELETRTRGGASTFSVALAADARLDTVPARVRLGLTADGAGIDGGLVEILAVEGGPRFDLATLMAAVNLPVSYGPLVNPLSYLSGFQARGVLLGRSAGSDRFEFAAEDVSGQLNGQTFAGQLAVLLRPGGPVVFVRSDQALTAGKVFPPQVQLGPFAALGLPQGLVILSPQDGDVTLGELHPRIYDKVFASYFDSPASARLPVQDGLTVLARLDLGGALPEPLDRIAAWLPSSGRVLVGGGIADAASANPTLGFYARLQGLGLRIPSPLDTLLFETVGGDAELFIRTKGPGGTGGEIELGTDVRLKPPRLDTLAQDRVDAKLSVAVASTPGNPATVSVGAEVRGTWTSPLGLSGLSLTNTKVSVGTSSAGVTVGIRSEEASLSAGSGPAKAIYLDLQTAWVGGAPTQLAVQAGKSASMAGDLLLSQADFALLAQSLMQTLVKANSSLVARVSERLAAAGASPAQVQLLSDFMSLANTTTGGVATLMSRSPLALVSVRNPTVYFATPGADLPPRQEVDPPLLGLGLRASGELLFDTGSVQVPIANGQIRMDLVQGWQVSGTMAPPSPFSGPQMSVSGTQPLLSPTPTALQVSFSGGVALNGVTLPVVNQAANASGSLGFYKTLDLSPGFNASGEVRLASGLASQKFTLELRQDQLKVRSDNAGCITLPVKVSADLRLGDLASLPDLLLGSPPILTPTVPINVLDCTPGWLRDVVGPTVTAVVDAAGAASDIAQVGARAVLGQVSGVPVVGAPAAAAAATVFSAAINPTQTTRELAEQGINAAIVAVTDPGRAVSSVVTGAVNVMNAARKELGSAIDALADIGCKLFSWMPGNHPCRQRERRAQDRRRAAADAYQAAVDAYRNAIFMARYEAERAPYTAAETARFEAQKQLATASRQRWIAVQADIDRVISLSTAARCSATQVWDAGTRSCVTPGVGHLVFTGNLPPAGSTAPRPASPCLSRSGTSLVVGTCSNADAMYWQLTNDRQIRAVLPRAALTATSSADMCLMRPANAQQDGAVTLATCKTGSGSAMASPAGTADWVYTSSGQFTDATGQRCLLRSSSGTGVTWGLCSSQAVPAGGLQWTPVVPQDLLGLSGLPRLARVQVSGTNLCLTTDGTYQSPWRLRSCSTTNLDQDLTFGFETRTHFTIQSMGRRSCVSIGDYKQTADQERWPLTEACFATESQQFELLRDTATAVRWRNRSSGRCLAIDTDGVVPPVFREDAELIERPCDATDLTQSFQVSPVTTTTARSYNVWNAMKPSLAAERDFDDAYQALVYYKRRRVQNVECIATSGQSGPVRFSRENCPPLLVVPGRIMGQGHFSLVYLGAAVSEDRVVGEFLEAWYDSWFLGVKTPAGSPPEVEFKKIQLQDGPWDLAATFKLVRGLSGASNSYSFESLHTPGSFVARRSTGDGAGLDLIPILTTQDQQRATFTLVDPGAGNNR